MDYDEVSVTHEDFTDGQASQVLCHSKKNNYNTIERPVIPYNGYVNIFSPYFYDGTSRDINAHLTIIRPPKLKEYYQKVLTYNLRNCTIYSCLCQIVEMARVVSVNSSILYCKDRPRISIEFILTTFLIKDAAGMNFCTKAMSGDLNDILYIWPCTHVHDYDLKKCFYWTRWYTKAGLDD